MLLAVFVLLLTAVWVPRPSIVVENSIVLRQLFLPASMVVPALLALFLLAGALAHGVRLGSTLLGSDDRTRSGDAVALSILASIVIGALAAYTLWLAVASLYVIYLGDPGGVLLHPYVVLALGCVLSALVLLRATFRRVVAPLLPISTRSTGGERARAENE